MIVVRKTIKMCEPEEGSMASGQTVPPGSDELGHASAQPVCPFCQGTSVVRLGTPIIRLGLYRTRFCEGTSIVRLGPTYRARCLACRKRFSVSKKDWKVLPFSQHGQAGHTFFDGIGIAFHVPMSALSIAVLVVPVGITPWLFFDPGSASPLSGLAIAVLVATVISFVLLGLVQRFRTFPVPGRCRKCLCYFRGDTDSQCPACGEPVNSPKD